MRCDLLLIIIPMLKLNSEKSSEKSIDQMTDEEVWEQLITELMRMSEKKRSELGVIVWKERHSVNDIIEWVKLKNDLWLEYIKMYRGLQKTLSEGRPSKIKRDNKSGLIWKIGSLLKNAIS